MRRLEDGAVAANWVYPHDREARIMKMKDVAGPAVPAYKLSGQHSHLKMFEGLYPRAVSRLPAETSLGTKRRRPIGGRYFRRKEK